jgi:hypothetical protein
MEGEVEKKYLKLLDAVQRMRNAQNDYFRSRGPNALVRAKQYEHLVDSLIKHEKVDPGPTQQALF